jgi:hypothetical protein
MRKQEDENRKENNERKNLWFVMDFYWSLNDGVSLTESHLSKASFSESPTSANLMPWELSVFPQTIDGPDMEV